MYNKAIIGINICLPNIMASVFINQTREKTERLLTGHWDAVSQSQRHHMDQKLTSRSQPYNSCHTPTPHPLASSFSKQSPGMSATWGAQFQGEIFITFADRLLPQARVPTHLSPPDAEILHGDPGGGPPDKHTAQAQGPRPKEWKPLRITLNTRDRYSSFNQNGREWEAILTNAWGDQASSRLQYGQGTSLVTLLTWTVSSVLYSALREDLWQRQPARTVLVLGSSLGDPR